LEALPVILKSLEEENGHLVVGTVTGVTDAGVRRLHIMCNNCHVLELQV
jgi:hypothetical protein